MDSNGIFRNVHVFAYTYMHTITIIEKDTVSLMDCEEEYIGGFGGTKRKCHCFIISKI